MRERDRWKLCYFTVHSLKPHRMQPMKRMILASLLLSLAQACSSPPSSPPPKAKKLLDNKLPDATLQPIDNTKMITPGRSELVSVEKAEGDLAYQKATLDNGLTILTLEDHTSPVAAIQLWFHVGSKNEAIDRTGFAHMFEHMMFRGTQLLGPKSHFDYIRKTGGDANAYTAFDQTVYVQEVPANQVEMVFWLESERMAFLRIDEDGFKTERNVVAEEFRMGREAPYGNVLEELLPKLFPKHPYSWSPIGDMDQLKASTSAELQTFWETYYIPNNATLVVVGDIKHEEVQELARKYFGWISRYPDPPKLAAPAMPATMPAIEVKAKNGPAPIVGFAFRGVPAGHKDAQALELLGSILGGGESSRLYKSLVVEKKTAMFALGGSFSLELEGVLGAIAVLSPLGSDKDVVAKDILDTIEKLRTEGAEEKELLKAKNAALRAIIEEQRTAANKANRLGTAFVIEKNLPDVNKRYEQIRAITNEDIKRVTAQYLAPEKAIKLNIVPNLLGSLFGGGGAAASAPTSEESKTPASGPTGKPDLKRPSWMASAPPVAAPLQQANFPAPKETVLTNGLKVVYLEDNELPTVTAFMGIPYGSFSEAAANQGTAAMASSMLTRGTKSYSYVSLSEELETYALTLSGSTNVDTTVVSASAIKDEAPRMMKLMAEAILTPTFPQDQLDLLRGQMKTGKAIEEMEPNYIADKELRKRLYGEHPYSRVADGDSKSLDKITPALMQKWWSTFVRPDTSTLYIAGNLSEADALKLAEESFGAWKATGAAPKVALPAFPAESDTKIYLVERAGNQAQIRVGYRALGYADPRLIDTRVINQVFGGGFSSRLNDAIRVKRGLSYGAGGGFGPQRFSGAFRVSTFSKNETVGETVQAIIDEIERLIAEPPTEEEVAVAKTYLSGSYVLQREEPKALLEDHWLIKYAGLPADYATRYLTQIDAATTATMKEAVNALIHSDKLVIVVVGDSKTLLPQLEKIAPVEVIK